MEPRDHVAKAQRIETSLRKLDPADDPEMIIETCMLAATHYFNAALHVEGITTQLMDHAHTFRPTLDGYIKKPSENLQAAMEPLKFIEQLRPKHCRDSEPISRVVIDKCLQSLEEAKTGFLEIVGDAARPTVWRVV